jgi:hypothetical protein
MLTIDGKDTTLLKMVSIYLMKKYEIFTIIIQYNLYLFLLSIKNN